MKKATIALLSLVLLLGCLIFPAAATETEEPAPLKVLLVGNSYALDSMPLVNTIANLHGDDYMVLGWLYYPGCWLGKHYQFGVNDSTEYDYYKNTNGTSVKTADTTLLHALKDEDWDLIFLQQAPCEAGEPDTFDPELDNLVNFINENKTNPDAKFGWHMTWAYQKAYKDAGYYYSQDFIDLFGGETYPMYQAIVKTTQDMVLSRKIGEEGAQVDEFVMNVPNGTALENARTSYFGDNVQRDTYHLNRMGKIITSYTWYAMLTGKTQLTSVELKEVSGLKLSEADRDVILESVNNAIANPFDRTMSQYTERPEEDVYFALSAPGTSGGTLQAYHQADPTTKVSIDYTGRGEYTVKANGFYKLENGILTAQTIYDSEVAHVGMHNFFENYDAATQTLYLKDGSSDTGHGTGTGKCGITCIANPDGGNYELPKTVYDVPLTTPVIDVTGTDHGISTLADVVELANEYRVRLSHYAPDAGVPAAFYVDELVKLEYPRHALQPGDVFFPLENMNKGSAVKVLLANAENGTVDTVKKTIVPPSGDGSNFLSLRMAYVKDGGGLLTYQALTDKYTGNMKYKLGVHEPIKSVDTTNKTFTMGKFADGYHADKTTCFWNNACTIGAKYTGKGYHMGSYGTNACENTSFECVSTQNYDSSTIFADLRAFEASGKTDDIKFLTEAEFAALAGNQNVMVDVYVPDGASKTSGTASLVVVMPTSPTKTIYNVKIGTVENGTVSLSAASGLTGKEITVTATPDSGYVLDQILVDGAAITGTTFTISGEHTVTATFVKEGSDPEEPEDPDSFDPTVPVDPTTGDVFFIPGQVTSGGIRREGYVIASNTLPLGQRVIINIPADADPGNYSWDRAGDTVTFTTGRFWEVIDGKLTVIGNVTLSSGTRPNKYGYHDHFSYINTTTGKIRLIDAYQHRAGATSTSTSMACGLGFEESCGGSTWTSTRYAYEVGPYLTFAAGTSFILDLRTAVLAGDETAVTTLDGLNMIKFEQGYTGNTKAPVVNTYAADAIYTPKTTKADTTAGTVGYNSNAGTVNAFVIVDGAPVYNVTAKQAENGTVSVDKAYGAAGTTVTVTATPAESYELEAIYVDGVAIEGNTFAISGDHTVTATFKAIVVAPTFAITVGAVENGTVTVDKTEAEAGETVTITATPAEGYALQEIYVDGAAIEGETFTVAGDHTVTAQFVKIAEYAGANVTMGNELNMNFALAKSKLAGLTGLYVKMVGPGGEKVVQQADWASSGASYYLFTYDGIAAKQMGDEITVTVYNARGNAVSVTKVDSMRAYVARSLDGATEATLKPLYVDMLNYGAAAQVNFGYKTDDLVNSWMTPEQQALATAEMKPITDQRVKGLNYKGTSLTLESRISMQLAFSNVKDKNLYAMVKFTNHSGNPVEERIDEVSVNGSYRTVRVEQIVVADGRKLVTVELYDADTNELVGSAVDSMESYIARSATGTYEWMKKIMIFSDSAYAYLHRNDAN